MRLLSHLTPVMIVVGLFVRLEPLGAQSQPGTARIILMGTSVQTQARNAEFSVWVRASGDTARGVYVEIPRIVNQKNEVVYTPRLRSQSSDIAPRAPGHFFRLKADTLDTHLLAPGSYSATVFVAARNAEPLLSQFSFEITAHSNSQESIRNVITTAGNWSSLLLDLFKTILFLFLLLMLLPATVLFITSSFRNRNLLHVNPIINETDSEKLGAVASGIDDILLVQLQDISRLSSKSAPGSQPNDNLQGGFVKTQSVIGAREQATADGKNEAQSLKIAAGGVSPELQKQIGDISIGPLKIPLSALAGILLKITGGTYISGALQNYGDTNKLILYLSHKPNWGQRLVAFIRRATGTSVRERMDSQIFESTWTSETLAEKRAQGIPSVVEELAYRIALALEEAMVNKVGTADWGAYKNFLLGNAAYLSYQKNPTRKDLLYDAIEHWRTSVRLDSEFAKAHYNLGVALEKQQLFEDAIFRYKKAIQLSPELVGANAHYNLAFILWRLRKDQKNFDERPILNELNRAQRLNAQLAEIHNLRGLLYSKRGDLPKEVRIKNEIESYNRAIELSGEHPDPIFFYNLCMVNYDKGNWKAAAEAGNRALNLYWQNAWAFYGSRTADVSGRTFSLERFSELLGSNSNVKQLIRFMGDIHFNMHDYREAIPFYQEYLRISPTDKNTLHKLSICLRNSGENERALLMLRRLILFWPEFPDGYAELVKTTSTTAQMLSSQEKMILEKLADTLRQHPPSANREEFLQAFAQQEDDPLQTKIYNAVCGSILNYVFRDQIAAYESFRRAFDSDAQSVLEAEFLFNCGASQMAMQRSRDAVLFFDKASSTFAEEQAYEIAQSFKNMAKLYATLQPDNADKYFQNASNYFNKGGFSHLAYSTHLNNAEFLMKWFWAGGPAKAYSWAQDECNKAILLKHTNYEAYHIKGNTYYDFRQYTEAIPQYEKAVELNFDLVGAHYNLGLCHYKLQHYHQAIREFETTIKLDKVYADPNNENKPDPYEKLITCFKALGEHDEAVNVARKAVNIHPASAKYKRLLGQTLADAGKADEAVSEYLDILSRNENDLQVLHRLAELYAEQGANTQLAYRMCRKALISFKKRIVGNVKEKLNKTSETKAAESDLSEPPHEAPGVTIVQEGTAAPETVQKQTDGTGHDDAPGTPETTIQVQEKSTPKSPTALDLAKKSRDFVELTRMRNTLGWILYHQNRIRAAILFLESSLVCALHDAQRHANLAYTYEKYATVLPDVKGKSLFLEKAEMQWRNIIKLTKDEYWSNLATERAKNLYEQRRLQAMPSREGAKRKSKAKSARPEAVAKEAVQEAG